MFNQCCHQRVTLTTLAIVLAFCCSFSHSTASSKTLYGRAQVKEYVTRTKFALPVYTWNNAKGQPKAIIVGFHGGAMHGRAYRTLAQKLAARNIDFVSFDMRGYGAYFREGFGTKRDRTFNYKRSLDDASAIVSWVRDSNPGLPVFFLGESLGANMSMILAAREPSLSDGLILVSPFASPKLFIYPQMVATAAQIAINPVSRVSVRPYLKRRMSNDPRSTAAWLTDPLSRDKQSLPELVQSYKTNFTGSRKAKQLPAALPVLVVLGANDRLCKPKATMKMFAKMPVRDKRLVVLKNQAHLIAETPYVKTEVVNMVSDWVNRRSSGAALAARRGAYPGAL
jgi:alpha-beta hydrolase superfamily lysophospholipase